MDVAATIKQWTAWFGPWWEEQLHGQREQFERQLARCVRNVIDHREHEYREDLDRARDEVRQLREVLGRMREWTQTFGAALKPKTVDSYGEGMRDAKAQVQAILDVFEAKRT